jgi:hypothetical protein
VRAPDAHGGLSRWLLTLFDAGRARGYQFTVHVPVSLPQPGLSDWSEGRFWGPPQSSAWLAKRLAEPAESVREVLLSVKGPYAGALLALEVGIHRWLAPKNPSTTAHLSVVLVAMRAVLSDADHASKLFRPTALPDRAIVLRMPAVREHDPEAETLTLRGGDITLPLPDDYWAAFDEIACEHLIAIALSDDESLEDLYAPPSSGVARDADGVDGEGTG